MALDILRLIRGFSRDKRKVLALIVAFISVLSLAAGLVGQMFIAAIIIAEIALSFFLGRMEIRQFGIELVTLATVLSGALYGPMAGALVGGVLLSMRFVLTKGLGGYVLYCVPMMIVIGAVSGYSVAFFGGIAVAGIVLSGIYNLVTASLGTAVMNDFIQEAVWSGTDFAINVFLFWYVAPAIFALA